MYCLTSMCYVCLDKKDRSLIAINSSLSVNKDIMHIIGYLPCNLGWLKTKRMILICKECCRRLRETYQFLIMCDQTSAVMQDYMDKINISSVSNAANEAELRVDMNSEQYDGNKVKCEIKLEDEEIYTVESVPITEDNGEVFLNVDDCLVKEENTWKSEVVDDEEEPPMENDSTESSDNESDSESSESTSTQGHTTNKKKRNTAVKNSHKCLTCSKSFSNKSILQRHTQVHTGEKPYKCATCTKCFARRSSLVRHMRIHSGEKPFRCARCTKCFSDRSNFVAHTRTHTGEKPFKCTGCTRCFSDRSSLASHMRIHTGEKPYECSRCKKWFKTSSSLALHVRRRTHLNKN